MGASEGGDSPWGGSTEMGGDWGRGSRGGSTELLGVRVSGRRPSGRWGRGRQQEHREAEMKDECRPGRAGRAEGRTLSKQGKGG